MVDGVLVGACGGSVRDRGRPGGVSEGMTEILVDV